MTVVTSWGLGTHRTLHALGMLPEQVVQKERCSQHAHQPRLLINAHGVRAG